MELEQFRDALEAEGIRIAAVTHDSQEILRRFAERFSIGYPLLSDAESGVIRARRRSEAVRQPIEHDAVEEILLGKTWSGSQFIVVGFNGTILSSPDGVSWTQQASGVSAHLRGITWSGSEFVVVGDGGTILTSLDGITWMQEASGTSNLLHEVIWAGTEFVAVGSSNTVLSSPDGVTWTALTPPVYYGTLRGVAWSGARLVAVGSDGQIITLH